MRSETETKADYPRMCRICFMDCRKDRVFEKPQEMSEHVESQHKGEVGGFLQRR